MGIKLLMGILGIAIGALVMRLINFHEICNLKDQLYDAEENNEKIIKDNAELSKENGMLKRRIEAIEAANHIPKFKD
jgi:hypothetical protein